ATAMAASAAAARMRRMKVLRSMKLSSLWWCTGRLPRGGPAGAPVSLAGRILLRGNLARMLDGLELVAAFLGRRPQASPRKATPHGDHEQAARERVHVVSHLAVRLRESADRDFFPRHLAADEAEQA